MSLSSIHVRALGELPSRLCWWFEAVYMGAFVFKRHTCDGLRTDACAGSLSVERFHLGLTMSCVSPNLSLPLNPSDQMFARLDA